MLMTWSPDLLAGGAGLALGLLCSWLWRGPLRNCQRVNRLREALQLTQAELDSYRYALNEHAIVAVTAPDGRILSTNERFSLISGYRADELIGRTHRVVSSGLTPPETYQSMWRALADGQVWRGEICNRAKSGNLYWVQTTIVPLRDASGTVVRLMAIDADITSRVQAEQELELAVDRANGANRAKSAFLANMSHELRTPMNAVIGTSQLLQETELSDEQREYVDLIRGGGETLLLLINDVLDLSKIEAGRIELDRHSFDLRSLIEAALDLSLPATHGRTLELISDIDPRIPTRLVGDSARLRQILINLIGNAVKFTERGRVLVSAAPKPAADGRQDLAISVEDTGIGIAADALTRIFDPFSQADASMSRRYGGTGLGLSISKRLVELMGGSIAVESELSRGSIFTIRVPLVFAADAGDAAPARSPRRHLLVVDDCPAARTAVGRLLLHAGHGVEEADSDLTAASRWAASTTSRVPIDAALIDAQMLTAPGSRLFAMLVAERGTRGIPIILMCPFGWRTDTRLGFTPAAQIRKPVKLADLTAAMDAVARASVAPGTRHRQPASRGRAAAWRALVVEDNPVNRLVAVKMLGRLGGEAIAVGGGAEAIARCAVERFDIIFMDCQMPGIDGYETSRRLKAAAPSGPCRGTPIVALTANALAENEQRCLDAGMDAYLAKPVRLEELRAALDKWVGAQARELEDLELK